MLKGVVGFKKMKGRKDLGIFTDKEIKVTHQSTYWDSLSTHFLTQLGTAFLSTISLQYIIPNAETRYYESRAFSVGAP